MLPDLLAPDLPLVICGTAAGRCSADRQQYYAGPRNKFWPTLHRVGLTDRLLGPESQQALREFGIGLTDVVKGQAGGDRSVRFGDVAREDLVARLAALRARVVCFNGKKAASLALGRIQPEFGLQPERFGATLVFVAPSTSGAANRHWDERIWQQLATLVRERRAAA